MEPKERIARQLMGWKPYEPNDNAFYDTDKSLFWDFDPENNPAHATMVWEKLDNMKLYVDIDRVPGNGEKTYCAMIFSMADSHGPIDTVAGDGTTWMQALYNAVIAYLDGRGE